MPPFSRREASIHRLEIFFFLLREIFPFDHFMRQEGKSRREGTIEKRREESEICLTIAFLLDGKIGEKEGGEREAGRQLASGAVRA